jgi:transformation/transcription domain-associated protein
MAFLAYVLRGSQTNIKEYMEVFPEACVRLLKDCPPEDVGTRKVRFPPSNRYICLVC